MPSPTESLTLLQPFQVLMLWLDEDDAKNERDCRRDILKYADESGATRRVAFTAGQLRKSERFRAEIRRRINEENKAATGQES